MTDVLIIGSGPAGMTAAIYAKRANMDVLIVEKEYEGTGQMAESSRIDNYPGFYGSNGYELGEKIREHVEALGIVFFEGEAVAFEKTTTGFKATLESGEVLESKTIIYSAGATHRKFTVPGSEKFEHKGISYCASCDGAFYREKDVAVIGGGNSALDDALLLSEICNKVYLIHRRAEFRGDASTLAKLEQKENVEIIRNAKVQEITGEKRAESLLLDTGKVLDIQGIFVAIGMIPQTEAVKDIVALDENGYIKAGEDGITSEKGFFVAGDVRTKELRQIITAAADGANAANSAIQYIIRR
ncbi:FAD-dependent oxidoreductase [uncultured Eubacterium sp.]|uniref:NAD(P)/FAD-dependent oxidoreductase n=1 Tax=uncultured Eubacterium sp. TaxID=165185 RepID=UPI0025F3D83E|nr:FAD-dependent oxidoreductase [uncultured Eubacterium sp.]